MTTQTDAAEPSSNARIQFISPTLEQLYSKLVSLNRELGLIDETKLNDTQKRVLGNCKDYLRDATTLTHVPWWRRKHSHLVWEYLHRIDESLLLLCSHEELRSRATSIRTDFDLNVKEEKIRAPWIGDQGKLITAIAAIAKAETVQAADPYRPVLKDALNLVNKTVDRSFWQLSMNTLTSVCSGGLLFALGLIFLLVLPSASVQSLADHWFTQADCFLLVLLGLMGAYASNVMTREDFLYVRGAPYWRFFLHHLFSKPVLSAFAALLVYIVGQSKLLFAIRIVADTAAAPADRTVGQIVQINVSPDAAGYVYAALAVGSGFAADKIIRSLIDRVLKRLESKAEKSKDTKV